MSSKSRWLFKQPNLTPILHDQLVDKMSLLNSITSNLETLEFSKSTVVQVVVVCSPPGMLRYSMGGLLKMTHKKTPKGHLTTYQGKTRIGS